MRTCLHLFLLSLLLRLPIAAQPRLEGYIAEGMAANEVLQQRDLAIERSLLALREAKALFGPSVAFNTNYFLAQGGRTVDFPVGDLFNPVYRTLNQMTGSANFPQLDNQSILLNPHDFYDARFRVSMPVVNAELIYNRRIQQSQADLRQIERTVYQRELVKEIKKAYFQYAQAAEAVRIYEQTQKLLVEQQRVNRSLLEADKVNRTALIRSDNELEKLRSRTEAAIQQRQSALAYLNFLLNKPLEAEVQLDSLRELPLLPAGGDVSGREELAQLRTATRIQEQVTQLSKAYWLPRLSAFSDFGSQGFEWKYNERTRYYFAGLSLEWNLFSSGKNKARVRQNELSTRILQSQQDYTLRQLQVQARTATHSFLGAAAQYGSAQAQVRTAEAYYQDLFRQYKAGQALYIELLDAQNQLTTARLELSVACYNAWAAHAEVERATAAYQLR